MTIIFNIRARQKHFLKVRKNIRISKTHFLENNLNKIENIERA